MNIKIIYISLAVLLGQYINAQTASVEKSIYSVQFGPLGFWLNNESRLSNEFSLRTEIGFDAGVNLKFGNQTNYTLAPSLNMEPRWYYNFTNRMSKNKDSKNNEANFLSCRISYIPDWFVISNKNNTNIPNQISLIPEWGVRRNILKSNFNYEIGIGIGFLYDFENKSFDRANDLHLRIGYTF
ncbi:hypothetical protein [Flavobacterium restrictum]|uniref:DUF3575 domain-containing protein n=1 Tax=Flavobacterium restrictum TaxID=2594428 RepID=A0A553EB97_9FLAO|nr:hypothetical protein [Flavobacterium restrictum]TRX42232.1 hypothetical protein FNW21_02935 [Flavobacterium restrictum]